MFLIDALQKPMNEADNIEPATSQLDLFPTQPEPVPEPQPPLTNQTPKLIFPSKKEQSKSDFDAKINLRIEPVKAQ